MKNFYTLNTQFRFINFVIIKHLLKTNLPYTHKAEVSSSLVPNFEMSQYD